MPFELLLAQAEGVSIGGGYNGARRRRAAF
jgi:hypothetical protein